MTTSTFDLDFFRLINGLAGTNQVLDFVAVFAARWLIYVLVGAVVWLGLMSWCRLREGVDPTTQVPGLGFGLGTRVLVFLSAMDSLIMTLVVFRLRPFASLDGVNLLIDPPLFAKSFPSDHTTLAFAVAVSVLMINRRLGIPALIVAAVVGLSRVFVGVHFPIDVLVGAALGTSWAVAVAVIGKKFDDRDRLLQFLLRKRTPSMDFHDQS